MTGLTDFDSGSVERVLRPLLETPSEQTDLFEEDPQIGRSCGPLWLRSWGSWGWTPSATMPAT